MKLQIGLMNVWVILVAAYLVIWLIMIIVNKIRAYPIEDPDLYQQTKHLPVILHYLSLLIFLVASLFIPINFESLPIGLMLIILGVIFNMVAILSFRSFSEGINGGGLYRFSRNPMYVGGALLIVGLIISGWNSYTDGAVLIICSIPWFVMTHLAVLEEEAFLEKKYGSAYLKYKHQVPRYFGFRHQQP
jgi:protein-S-isoprenylcysteine O-methyltransferase Ste14